MDVVDARQVLVFVRSSISEPWLDKEIDVGENCFFHSLEAGQEELSAIVLDFKYVARFTTTV